MACGLPEVNACPGHTERQAGHNQLPSLWGSQRPQREDSIHGQGNQQQAHPDGRKGNSMPACAAKGVEPMAVVIERPALLAARRPSRRIQLGTVDIGGGSPVSIQSMAITKTEDVAATLVQVHALATQGADIVRVAVPPRGRTKEGSDSAITSNESKRLTGVCRAAGTRRKLKGAQTCATGLRARMRIPSNSELDVGSSRPGGGSRLTMRVGALSVSLLFVVVAFALVCSRATAAASSGSSSIPPTLASGITAGILNPRGGGQRAPRFLSQR